MTKKNPCPDCNYCQQCGEDRCRLCLKAMAAKKKGPKLSFAEQIDLYEKLNGREVKKAPTRCVGCECT